jgi:hypothetical protein
MSIPYHRNKDRNAKDTLERDLGKLSPRAVIQVTRDTDRADRHLGAVTSEEVLQLDAACIVVWISFLLLTIGRPFGPAVSHRPLPALGSR